MSLHMNLKEEKWEPWGEEVGASQQNSEAPLAQLTGDLPTAHIPTHSVGTGGLEVGKSGTRVSVILHGCGTKAKRWIRRIQVRRRRTNRSMGKRWAAFTPPMSSLSLTVCVIGWREVLSEDRGRERESKRERALRKTQHERHWTVSRSGMGFLGL